MSLPSPDPEQRPAVGNESDDRGRLYARLVAGLVLIPSIPLLLASVGALALFYVAPTRFGQILARLPGDQYMRSALAFAPAVLLALVILAILYLLEGPAPTTAELSPASLRDKSGATPWIWLARRALILLVPVLSLATVAALLSFAIPDHFSNWLAFLPGQRYLRVAVAIAPFAIGALTGIVALISRRGGDGYTAWPWAAWLPRLLPAILLALASLMLAASVAALGLFTLQPARLESLLDRIPAETVLRLELAFAPIVLLAVVMLAALSLLRGRSPPAAAGVTVTSPDLMWLISAGLILAMIIGATLMVGAALLLLR